MGCAIVSGVRHVDGWRDALFCCVEVENWNGEKRRLIIGNSTIFSKRGDQ